MRSGLRDTALRAALALAGEAIQSAFHFGINVALARALGVDDYGTFAIVMVVGAIALTYMRALVGLPAALLVSERRGSRAARGIEAAFGSAAALLGLAFAIAAVPLFALWLHRAALSAAFFVGLWSFRSYLRALLLAERRQTAALLSDLMLAGAGSALAAALLRPGAGHPLDLAFLALAGGNIAAVAAALAGGRARLRPTFRRSMRARFATLSRQMAWSAAATTSANAQATGQVLLVAAVGGPEVYAPMAAMLALFAPVRLLTAGLTNVIVPELAATAARGRIAGVGRAVALWTTCALAGGLLYGGLAAAALPLMGKTVFAGQPTGLIFGLAWGTTTTFFLSLVPRLLLEVRRQFRVAAAIGSAGAVAGMVVVVFVLTTGHPAWALSGNLVAELLVLAGTSIAVARTPGSAGSGRDVDAPSGTDDPSGEQAFGRPSVRVA